VKVSKEDVLHVAKLSQLDIAPEEVEMFREQLTQILDWQDKLNELDLTDMNPTAHVLEMNNVMREDETRPSLSVKEALKNAPDKEGSYFKVPRIME